MFAYDVFILFKHILRHEDIRPIDLGFGVFMQVHKSLVFYLVAR